MGGANPNDQITATHLNFNKGAGSGVPVASVDKKWDVQSAHPEAVTQGMIKGIGSLATSAIGAGAGAMSPNATGGYNSKLAAQTAAPYASGVSNVEGMGWVPQAQAVNAEDQPDQMQRLYGRNY